MIISKDGKIVFFFFSLSESNYGQHILMFIYSFKQKISYSHYSEVKLSYVWSAEALSRQAFGSF